MRVVVWARITPKGMVCDPSPVLEGDVVFLSLGHSLGLQIPFFTVGGGKLNHY